MNFEKFTIKSQEALQKSAEIATARQQQSIEPAHLLKSILETDENVVDYLIKKLNIDKNILDNRLEETLNAYPKVSGAQAYLSSVSNAVLQNAEKELKEFNDEYISIEHLLLVGFNQRPKRRLLGVPLTLAGLGFDLSIRSTDPSRGEK